MWFGSLIGIAIILYATIKLIRGKLNKYDKKAMKIIIAGACIFTYMCSHAAVSDMNNMKNPEICRFKGTLTYVEDITEESPNYYFTDGNGGKHSSLNITYGALEEMNLDTLEKGKQYIVCYETKSSCIVYVEKINED